MASLARRERFELPDQVRKFFEGDWEVPAFPIEEYQDGNSMVIRAELPNINPEQDLDVTVSDGMLHIKGERREQTDHKGRNGYRSEFRYGSFTREVALPSGASQDDVTASYNDGVLEVRVPVPEVGPSSKKVPISRG
ncbi:Hsp20/alpha crystallin family protein [Arthrobacter sp. zg-Y20]|uniref:Hsp20/alpha crystallin family protein n=1 Tax=unclassified Arthrobacter TaxID=235627 RepID=UPI001D13CE21|nr:MULTISPECIES: Hsp20/alpha crystallin family protein [unclassified Arthrobacter]MCC3274664.1 Hsp20/alpha crystallin family protein [Arthrobacter sp. zg-Y20]MDK1314820.1 Hsp20/alpha crystallin family protein [Arthrobacter sp. zg.Y20]WIB04684.1 Hsp20/alpha crystallin family protein [Arthrobacter sp. zg-Y20]